MFYVIIDGEIVGKSKNKPLTKTDIIETEKTLSLGMIINEDGEWTKKKEDLEDNEDEAKNNI